MRMKVLPAVLQLRELPGSGLGLLSRRFGGGEGGAALPPHQGVSNPSETAWLGFCLPSFLKTPQTRKNMTDRMPRVPEKNILALPSSPLLPSETPNL